jgi:isoleucyl-tRNA synthetase
VGITGQGEEVNRTLREAALDAVEATAFYQAGVGRLEAMIKNRPDWCVSRQRNWGVPMSLLVHKRTHELHPRTGELLEEVARRVEQSGIEAWFSLEPTELLGDEAKDYQKLLDTLDVWFDSGSSNLSVLKGPEWPADVYLEGPDQYRGWFHISLLTSCAIDGRPPYAALLTHGFVVDGSGHKMSKSKGTSLPQKVMDTAGQISYAYGWRLLIIPGSFPFLTKFSNVLWRVTVAYETPCDFCLPVSRISTLPEMSSQSRNGWR